MAPIQPHKEPHTQIAGILGWLGGLQSIAGKRGVSETRTASGTEAITCKRTWIISTTEGVST